MSNVRIIETQKTWSNIDIAQSSKDSAINGNKIAKSIIKRSFDIVISLIAIIAISPILIIVALIIKFNDGGPVIYTHKRIGLDGASFGCLKFRSMRTDAGERLAELLASDAVAKEEWEATRKLKEDPRITTVGNVLRKSSIDELPQLINILRGDMSLVGPRPITSDELYHYGEYIAAYFAARPGLTGRWQVSGRNDVSYQHRVMLDVQYIRSWSLLADFVILAKTIPALFSQRGSY